VWELLDLKEILDNLALQDQWEKWVLLDLKAPEEWQEIQVFLASQGRMESLDLREKEEPLESMDQQGLKEHPEWLDPLDLLGSQAQWVSQEYLEHLESLVNLEDLERQGKKDLLDLQVLREDQGCPVHQGYQVFLEREDCQAFLVCLD